MRIPNQTLHQSHAATYGAGALELSPGVDEPGCPRLYEAKYVSGTIPFDESWQRSYGSVIHAAIDRFEQGSITPEAALREVWPSTLGVHRFAEAVHDLERLTERLGTLTHTIATEEHLTLHLYDDPDYGPVSIGGNLDRIAIDNVNPHILFFDDYKTDRRPPSYAKLGTWYQGLWYGALLRGNAARWLADDQVERVEIVGRYEAVKWYGLNRNFTNRELDIFLAWAAALARRILRDKKAKPALNPSCPWCPIRHDCPEWKKLPGKGVALLERMAEMTLERRLLLLDKAADVRKKLESMEDDIDEALRERLLVSGTFEANGMVYTLADASKRYADPREIHPIMGPDFYSAVSVRVGDVDDWLDEHPEAKPAVGRVMGRVPAKPTLKISPIPEES